MKSVSNAIRTTLELAQAALAKEKKPLSKAIAAADAQVKAAESAASSASQAKQAADEVVIQVARAANSVKDGSMDEAIAAAKREQKEAGSRAEAAGKAVNHARRHKHTVEEPLVPLVDIINLLSRSWTDGGKIRYAQAVAMHVRQAFAKARPMHPAIGPALENVAELEAALQQHEAEVTAARSADSSMKQACAKTTSKAVQKAGTAAAARLTEALRRQAELQQQLGTAREELNKAQAPIQHLVALEKSLAALEEAARAEDTAHDAAVEEARLERIREQEWERANDPCTCSETNCPCSHCRSEQNYRATQGYRDDNDMTR